MLRSTLLQGGLSGIEAYFRTKEEIASLDAVIGAAKMKLEGFIESCLGGKARVARGRVRRAR